IEKFDVKDFGAQFAYTVDGGKLGEITNETWSADSALVTFHGKSTHPGSAKGIMVNSLYAAGDFISRFPATGRPDNTEGREGYIDPYSASLGVEQSTIKMSLRSFDPNGLEQQQATLKKMVAETQEKFPKVKITLEVKHEYSNMKEVLKDYPRLSENALEAAKRAGLNPKIVATRGGTDGSELTFEGLPCPDIFTGGHNFHGKLEFNSVRGLNKTVETLVNLVQIFAAETTKTPQ